MRYNFDQDNYDPEDTYTEEDQWSDWVDSMIEYEDAQHG